MAGVVKMDLSAINIPADASAIARELQRQWQNQAPGASVLRTRTLNLVIVSRADPVPPAVISQLAEAHPCRAIVVDLSSGITALDAQVSSSCILAHTGAHCLAREEVRLHAPTEVESNKLESIVASLLVPGLATFLWWRGEPAVDSGIFRRLAARCDRIVLDSTEYEDPWSGLAALQRAISERRWVTAITDLAWSRITAWRELTAQFFDNRTCANYPARIRIARIAGGGSRLSSGAVLFAAWIARQLGWQTSGVSMPGPGVHHLTFQRDGNPTEIELITHHDARPGLRFVQLIAGDDRNARFSIERTADGTGLVTTSRLGAQPQVQRTVRCRTLNAAEMLGLELSSVSRDTLYEAVVSVVAEMMGAAR